MEKIHIGIIAPSSVVPRVELQLGVARIRQEGFSVSIHPQCKKNFRFFAGTDEERASAIFDYASDAIHSVLWSARGGYGTARLLTHLDQLTEKHGVPKKKLLAGYSDATALMEYVRAKWGWSTLHAPMPCLKKFSILEQSELSAIFDWMQKKPVALPWRKKQKDSLVFWTKPPESEIRGTLVGGNLTVWNSLLGTRFEASAKGKILFLEDVDESLYKIDRMLNQLALSRSIEGVKAVVLGNFMNCKDHPPWVLKSQPKAGMSLKAKTRLLEATRRGELKPLRKELKAEVTIKEMFTEWGNRLGVPVAFGLPVGHGPEVSPLPLGAEFTLSLEKGLDLVWWDWF